MVTVLSSTRIPIARASPLKDIRLMVCPNNFKNNTAEIIAIGIVRITMKAARLSPRNSKTINPVNVAPITPSKTRLFTEFIT